MATTTETLWSTFIAALQANVALAAYVKTWWLIRFPKTISADDFPFLHIFPERLVQDGFFTLPKRKTSKLVVQVSGKVYGNDPAALVLAQLHFDDLIRNACETDLQLAGKALIVRVGESLYEYIDETVLDTRFTVEIETQPFVAGAR